MWDALATFAGIACLIILLVVCISWQFELGPKDPTWRRRWDMFTYGAMGLFLLWLIMLFVFIKPQGQ